MAGLEAGLFCLIQDEIIRHKLARHLPALIIADTSLKGNNIDDC
jgi:hypothetical protein